MKYLNTSLKKFYENNGFVVIRNLINIEQINIAKIDLQKYLEDRNKSKKNINKTTNRLINSVHDMDNWKWTKRIQKDAKLRKIVKYLIGSKISDFGAELFAKPAEHGLASPIHQDNYYWCLKESDGLTVWIALDAANKKNGAIFYYKGTHKLGLLEHKPSYAPGSSQTIKYPNSMKFFKKEMPELNPGDCIIHNSLVVHGSNKNNSKNSRVGWTLRFKSLRNQIDLIRSKRYKKELRAQKKSMKI